MKKLTLALLGAFVISIPPYAQAGGIGTIIDTIQILQDINDMLDGNSNDDGYYDDGYYNNDGYDDRYNGYGHPPPRPDYGYRHRPSYPPQEPEDGYDVPRHRAGYPHGPQDRMGQTETENQGSRDGMIGRPERHSSMGNPQGGFDDQGKRMDRPDYQDKQDGNRRSGRFSKDRYQERTHDGGPFSSRRNQDHPGGIFNDRTPDRENQRGGMFRNRNGSHDGIFGSRNRRDSRGGLFGREHRQNRGGMFDGGPHRRHGSFGGGHHNRYGGSNGRHHGIRRI